jgi:ABC-2 type transport system ATP-binding protein
MDHGKIVAYGTHAELIRLVGELTRVDLTLNAPSPSLVEGWQKLEGVSSVRAEDGKVTVLAQDSNLALPHLFETATSAKVRITSVVIQEPNLETVFLHLTGRALRDE